MRLVHDADFWLLTVGLRFWRRARRPRRSERTPSDDIPR